MSNTGRVRVVVKSRRVPVRTVEYVSRPSYALGGVPSSIGIALVPTQHNERAIIYESVLDDEFRRAIEEGERLACNLGLELEIVDRSRFGLFKRVLSSFRNGSGAADVLISPSLAREPIAPAPAIVPCN